MQKFPHTFDGFRRKSCIWQFTGNNIGVQLHKWCTTPFSKPGKGPFWRKRDTKESKGCPTFTFWCHLQDADISEPSFDVLIPAGANIFDVLYLLWLWLVSKSRWQIENLVVMVNQLVLIHLRQHCLHHRPCQPGNWLEGFYHHIPHHAPYLHNPRQALWTSWSVWPPTTPSSSCWPSSCMPFLNTADTMRWLVYIKKVF